MSSVSQELNDSSLILAAEDCDPEQFSQLHRFSKNDERVIAKLIAHGPVLLQGGRGSGKSALMIEAAHRTAPQTPEAPVFGVYLSLRSLPLVRSTGKAYEEILCNLLIERVRALIQGTSYEFDAQPDIASVQHAIADLSANLDKRIVILFDDAAHIGREAPLADFFDMFRMLSSSTVSCKATIYPGVTEFGTRFDVYNDATIVDVIRDEEQAEFGPLFSDVVRARFPLLSSARFSSPLTLERTAEFLARSVLGNMRGFVFACSDLLDKCQGGRAIGLSMLGETLLGLATDYYWPLLDEVTPKLGKYVPMVEPAKEIADVIIMECGKSDGRRSALVHRDLMARLSKPFEILEYAGFISRREASRAMKSGGRGSRFAVNLCNLFETVHGTRLTIDLFERWSTGRDEPVEFHVRGSKLSTIQAPKPAEDSELAILKEPINKLARSKAYPYGLTQQKIKILESAGINTVGDLAEATDKELLALDTVGQAMVQRFRNVVAQAIWM